MNNAEYKYGCSLGVRIQAIQNEEIVWHDTMFWIEDIGVKFMPFIDQICIEKATLKK